MKSNTVLVIGNIVLILAILLGGAVPARAFYQDEEVSEGNLITAGAVALETVMSAWDEPSVATDLSDGDQVVQEIAVDTTRVVGEGNFVYRMVFDEAGAGFCSDVFVLVERNGAQVGAGSLASIAPLTPIGVLGQVDMWTFTFSPLGDTYSEGGLCDIRYAFDAYEESAGSGSGFSHRVVELSAISSSGFGEVPEETEDVEETDDDETEEGDGSDGEATSTSTDSGTSTSTDPGTGGSGSGGGLGLVINEVAADAIAEWGPFLGGKEWIEIYNNGDTTVDLDGWVISEFAGMNERFYTVRDESEENSELYTMLEGTMIGPGEYRVLIFVKQDVLNNNTRSGLGWSEIVSLYQPFDTDDEEAEPVLVDTQTIVEAVDERSDGLVPDGVGAWQKTERTPNAPNIAKPVSDEDL